MDSKRGNETEQIPLCTRCGHVEGLDPGEAIISWSPGVEIRADDIVIIHHSGATCAFRMYLRAERHDGGLCLKTHCGFPPFHIKPGAVELDNGLSKARILGVLRGAFLPL